MPFFLIDETVTGSE